MIEKKLILHIGLGKCGTSSLQSFLALNSGALSNLGMYYPEIESVENAKEGHITSGNGNLLACSLLNETHFFYHEGYHEKMENLKGMLRLREENTVILSSEMFSVLNSDQASDFVNQLNLWGFEVTVICYIRRQDEIALASYVQGLIAGHSSTAHSFEEEVWRISKTFRYSVLLEPWINLPKGNRFIVRPFDKDRLIKGDVVSDFLSILEIEEADNDFIWPEKINVSLNAVSSYLLYHARKNGFEDDVVQRLVDFSRNSEWGSTHAAITLVTEKYRQRIMNSLEEDNAEVARSVLESSDGALFGSRNENPKDAVMEGVPDLLDALPLIRHILENVAATPEDE